MILELPEIAREYQPIVHAAVLVIGSLLCIGIGCAWGFLAGATAQRGRK